MSKNDRKWAPMTAETLTRIAEQIHRAANDLHAGADLLEAEAQRRFDVSDEVPDGG